MIIFIGFLAASSPWLLGALLALNLVRRKETFPGMCPLLAGIGGYVGCIGISGVIWLADQSGTTVLRPESLYIIFATQLCLLLRIVLGLIHRIPCRFSVRRNSVSWWRFALAAFCLSIIVYSLLAQALLPTQAWDSLSFWADMARQFNLHSAEEWQAPFEFVHRHPPTLFLLLSWSGWSSEVLVAQSFPQWPWLCTWFSVGLIVFGFSRAIGVASCPSLILTLVITSTPLIENHGLNAGYGELLLTTAMLGCCSLFIIGCTYYRVVYIYWGALLSLSSLTLKNTGVFYAFLPLVSFFIVLLFQQTMAKKTIFGTLLAAFLALLLFKEIAFSFLGNKIYINFANVEFAFAGYDLTLEKFSLAELLKNHLHAWFLNGSFHQLALAFIACIVSIFLGTKDSGSIFLQITILSGFFILALSQLTQYGFEHATPMGDTGNSRFSMPIFSLVILGVAMQVAKLRKDMEWFLASETADEG